MLQEKNHLHQVPREECVLPITRSTDGEGKTFYPGDALDISLSTGTGPTLVVFTHRRHGVVYGWLDGYSLDDIGTWSAKVAANDGVRLIPFDIAPCGCVRNLGGYMVRFCTEHVGTLDELERCEKHRRPMPCDWCAQDIEREGQQAVRLGLEDRSYIEEAQS